jgi:hypothetical protein
MDNMTKEWYNYPIVIFTGILVLYTASNSIIALLNL